MIMFRICARVLNGVLKSAIGIALGILVLIPGACVTNAIRVNVYEDLGSGPVSEFMSVKLATLSDVEGLEMLSSRFDRDLEGFIEQHCEVLTRKCLEELGFDCSPDPLSDCFYRGSVKMVPRSKKNNGFEKKIVVKAEILPALKVSHVLHKTILHGDPK